MSARLEQRELTGVRWVIGQVMVLVSLAGAYAIDLGAFLLLTAGLGMVLLVMIFPRLIIWLPAFFWRVAPAGVLAVIIADFVLSGGDILPPLFRMIVILTLYRAMQARSPREDMQLLLLTLFIILITGVLSLEITFGIQMLVYAPLAMGLLFTANLSYSRNIAEPESQEQELFYYSGWRKLIRRLSHRVDRRTLLAGAVLFLMTTSMALALFIFLPRFDIGAALPFPRLQTAQSLTGFSDHVKYGDVVSILNDDAIAMRVDVEMESPPARPYWRMVALDAYYDGGFMVSPEVAKQRRTLNDFRFDFENDKQGGEDSVWTLYVEGGISSYLPAGDSFQTLRFKNRIELQLHELTRVLKTNETNATTLSLRYEGLGFEGILPVDQVDMRLTGLKPIRVDTSNPRYLKEISYPATTLVVPEGVENTRILRAALRKTGPLGNRSVTDFSRRVITYLQGGRGYSLDTRIPEGSAETVLRWVDSGLDGHCELYAGAFVIISRYAGIPARLVTGYAGGDWNGYENYFMVRHRNAHAWVEVFDPGKGWIRMDPTPGYLGDPGSVDNALAGGGLRLDRTWQAYLDSLKVLWFRRVIQFDGADQAMMADSFKGIGSIAFDWLKRKAEAVRSSLNNDWQKGIHRGQWSGLIRDLSVPAGVIVVLSVAIILIQRIRKRGHYEALMRKRAGQLLKSLSRKLPMETPACKNLLIIRYGPMDSWPEDSENFMKQLRRRPKRFIAEAEGS